MRLVIADDHTLFRDALVQYIERAEVDVEISLAKDLYEVMDIMNADSEQDLILLDLRMPGMYGMDGIRQVREAYPDVPVALMSGIAETKDVEKAFALGAVGYFPKTLSGKALLAALQKVMAGEIYVPTDGETSEYMPSYYADEEEDLKNKNIPEHDFQLTPRELDVLKFLSKGMANKEIARELDLQVVTVKLHVSGVCKKLDAQNRTQAALKAVELGILKSK